MTVLMRARNSGDTRWITWSANTADYEGIHAPEPILLNSAILEIIFGAAASKVDNDSTVEGTYVSDALEYLNQHGGGGGGITGPEVTTDNAVVRWDGTDGYFVKNSVAILNEIGGFSLGADGYIEIGSYVSETGNIRLNLGGYITGIVNGGIDVAGADGLTGGNINILSGDSSEDETNAGNIIITGGKSTGIPGAYGHPSTKGGCVNITGGESSNNAGGIISITGGTSENSYVGTPPMPGFYFDPLQQGGVINIQGGDSNIGTGGSVYLTGGTTNDITKECGWVTIKAGTTYTADGIAGSVSISGGAAQGGTPGNGGTAGNVSISGGTGGWGEGGAITISAGGGWVSGGPITISSGIASAGGGGSGGDISVYAGRSEGSNNGGDITIEAGRADELGTGGSVTIKSGRNNEASWNTGGDGGNILIESGASGGDGNTSGEINITSGNGDYVGPITIQSGNATDGDGGDINILGGGSINSEMDPDKVGGTVTISGGYGNYAHGGNVVLNGGSDSSDYGGNVIINGGIGNVVGGGGDIILSTFNGGIIELNKIEFNDGYFSALNETEIRLYGSDNHFSGFKASTTGTNNIWTLPEDDGPDGYVLTTDGSGNLSWSEVLDGSDELDGYNLAIDYTPTNYTTPVNNIIGEHIAAIDASLSNPVTDLTIADEEQGSILYFDGSDWVQLAPGDDGYALVTHSTGANPTWSSVQAAAPIDSVFGRTGAITAASDDYAASEIDNDSTVTGEQVSDALEYLDGYVASVADDVAAVSTMAVSGDLSGNLPNPTVTDLTITGEEQGSVLYFDGGNWVQLPPGEDGYVLTTHGTAAPTWEEASSGSGGTSIVVMTTPGTSSVTIPLDATILRVSCGGAGGGGGGGVDFDDHVGGAGGYGGCFTYPITLDAAALREIADSISVTVGAGGAGGSNAGGEDPWDPDPGDDGGASSVSIGGTLLIQASGGIGGNGNGDPTEQIGDLIGEAGGIASDSDGSAPTPPMLPLFLSVWGGGGGGAGGGSTGATHLGGDGGLAGHQISTATPAAGGGLGSDGTAGGAAITYGRFAGRGGGGGGGQAAGNAGNGGAGQTPGGGGGGGGSCKEGYTAGTGGAGGDGLVILEWL